MLEKNIAAFVVLDEEGNFQSSVLQDPASKVIQYKANEEIKQFLSFTYDAEKINEKQAVEAINSLCSSFLDLERLSLSINTSNAEWFLSQYHILLRDPQGKVESSLQKFFIATRLIQSHFGDQSALIFVDAFVCLAKMQTTVKIIGSSPTNFLKSKS